MVWVCSPVAVSAPQSTTPPLRRIPLSAPRGTRAGLRIPLVLAPGLWLVACAGMAPATYVHQNYDFSLVRRVAVLPLENLSPDQTAGEKVRRVTITEILSTGVVDVIEPGQVNRVLAQQNIQNPAVLLPEDFKRLGAALGVQLLVVGSVETYDRVTIGGVQAPEVTLTLRGVDVESGTIVWATSHTRGGATLMARLFGLTGDSLSEVARKTVREAVATLFR